ncbi:MAG: GGDEF domain-containing protein [Sulfurimonas sp.]|nr:GGDEF domain-containing protein [Sulfurimonas sp.]
MLKQNIRKTDIYARWGGEEFMVAFVNTSIDEAVNISNKLKEAIQKNKEINFYVSTPVTISCGITQCLDSDTADSIIARADKAMYNAKNSGKNKVCLL